MGQVNYAYGAVEERQLRTDNVVEERIASSYNPQSRDALLPTEVLVECRDTFIERTNSALLHPLKIPQAKAQVTKHTSQGFVWYQRRPYLIQNLDQKGQNHACSYR